MKKKLAIICAGVEQVPLVNKAKEMGVETHCFAWDKEGFTQCKGIADYFHPISIFEKEQILEKCKEIKIDGITTICSDISMPTVAFVAQNMELTGNRYDDTVIMVNKYKARRAFFNYGVNQPRFTVAYEGEEPDMTGLQYPLIVKPTDRGASVGIKKVENEAELKDAIVSAQQLAYSKEAIIEEFLSGKEVCAECISWDYEPYILAITETETLGGPHYSKIAYHQPAQLDANEQTKVADAVRKALKALNFICGPSDIEMVITKEGDVKIVELNPRMGGDSTDKMVKLSTGYDFLEAAVNLAFGQFEKPVLTLNKHSGIYFLSKETEYLKPIIENSKNDPDIVFAEIEDSELRYLQGADGRSGYFIYQSEQLRRWR